MGGNSRGTFDHGLLVLSTGISSLWMSPRSCLVHLLQGFGNALDFLWHGTADLWCITFMACKKQFLGLEDICG